MTAPAAGAGELRIPSTDGVELEGHLAPGQGSKPGPGLLLLHGFPSGSLSAENVGKDQPELADRIAIEMGWTVLSIRLRGCGTSTGDFSLAAWIDDARAGLAHLRGVMRESSLRTAGHDTDAQQQQKRFDPGGFARFKHGKRTLRSKVSFANNLTGNIRLSSEYLDAYYMGRLGGSVYPNVHAATVSSGSPAK